MERVSDTEPYEYPTEPHRRRHGPTGYDDYSSYRPWLEDEFLFRCIYCLKRIVWAPTDAWVVDHLIPQKTAPHLVCEYENLVFACDFCNKQKGASLVPDPSVVAYGACLKVNSDGSVTPQNENGRRLLDSLRLNHDRYKEERRKNIQLISALRKSHPLLYERLMGFPENLRDLRKLKCNNRRPKGLEECCFARRSRGELPTTY